MIRDHVITQARNVRRMRVLIVGQSIMFLLCFWMGLFGPGAHATWWVMSGLWVFAMYRSIRDLREMCRWRRWLAETQRMAEDQEHRLFTNGVH